MSGIAVDVAVNSNFLLQAGGIHVQLEFGHIIHDFRLGGLSGIRCLIILAAAGKAAGCKA